MSSVTPAPAQPSATDAGGEGVQELAPTPTQPSFIQTVADAVALVRKLLLLPEKYSESKIEVVFKASPSFHIHLRLLSLHYKLRFNALNESFFNFDPRGFSEGYLRHVF